MKSVFQNGWIESILAHYAVLVYGPLILRSCRLIQLGIRSSPDLNTSMGAQVFFPNCFEVKLSLQIKFSSKRAAQSCDRKSAARREAAASKRENPIDQPPKCSRQAMIIKSIRWSHIFAHEFLYHKIDDFCTHDPVSRQCVDAVWLAAIRCVSLHTQESGSSIFLRTSKVVQDIATDGA